MNEEEYVRRVLELDVRLNAAVAEARAQAIDVQALIEDHDLLSMRLSELERGVAQALRK